MFPWVLTNYESEELDLTLPGNFRDLSKVTVNCTGLYCTGATTERASVRVRAHWKSVRKPSPLLQSVCKSCQHTLQKLHSLSDILSTVRGNVDVRKQVQEEVVRVNHGNNPKLVQSVASVESRAMVLG